MSLPAPGPPPPWPLSNCPHKDCLQSVRLAPELGAQEAAGPSLRARVTPKSSPLHSPCSLSQRRWAGGGSTRTPGLLSPVPRPGLAAFQILPRHGCAWALHKQVTPHERGGAPYPDDSPVSGGLGGRGALGLQSREPLQLLVGWDPQKARGRQDRRTIPGQLEKTFRIPRPVPTPPPPVLCGAGTQQLTRHSHPLWLCFRGTGDRMGQSLCSRPRHTQRVSQALRSPDCESCGASSYPAWALPPRKPASGEVPTGARCPRGRALAALAFPQVGHRGQGRGFCQRGRCGELPSRPPVLRPLHTLGGCRALQ
ncbi:uncharacterized protein [Physeter macrocephalus]|uniref:Uncharacterized protein n=1 Tax=Physeter macrocephalus TaxID=9755 RepID=A0A9W2X015_PHYMC|nr:uncharacterized protein LOC129392572 [Physeter catodon]